METQLKNNFNELVEISENLAHSINELGVTELQEKVAEYTRRMEDHFLVLKSREPTNHILEELKKLMLIHEKVTLLFNKERDKASSKLKKLHAGKEMQNTYP